jgi:Flp pilus assembly protein TadG
VRPSGARGNSTVEFVLVSVLVLALFLLVLQVAFTLHARNLLVASAQEGARFGANADRGRAEAEARTREVVGDALSPTLAGRMSYTADEVAVDGRTAMRVTVSGPLPVVFLPAGPLRLTVQGHALEEGR